MLLQRQEEEVDDDRSIVKSIETLRHRSVHKEPNDLKDNGKGLVHQVGTVPHQELERPIHLVGSAISCPVKN